MIVTPAAWPDLQALASNVTRSPGLVGVGLDDADADAFGASAAWGIPAVRGRGLDGFRWALAWLRQRLEYPFEELAYGDHPDQIADLRLPDNGGDVAVPVAVLLPGGFWRERWVRDTIEPLAIDLARRGFATLKVEYRRVGVGFHGWRDTGADVAAAIDQLAASSDRLDLARVVVVGHSAGAQLAAWAIKRHGQSSPEPRVRPIAVVLLAGMLDLRETARRGLGDTGNPTVAFIGEPSTEGDYDRASPQSNLPLGVTQIIVQSARDSADLVDIGRHYAEKARASGDPTVYLESEEGDHFTVITPSSGDWAATVTAIRGALDGQPCS